MERRVVGEGVGVIRIVGTVSGVVEELRFSSILAASRGGQKADEGWRARRGSTCPGGFYRAEKPEGGEGARAGAKGVCEPSTHPVRSEK